MTIPELAVGLSDSSYTATYIITPDDVGNGFVENTTVATAVEFSVPSTDRTYFANLPLLDLPMF